MTSTRHDILQRIGGTPLVELPSYSTNNVRIFAKLEWYNPFGSVKDRPAFWMIREAEKKGTIKKGESIIIEPTSGNTGIALAGIAQSMGYKVEIVIPERVSNETKSILKNLGAVLHETSDDLCPRVGTGTDQSIALAKAIAKPRPDLYFMPNQYENDANFLSHYEGTGPEIWEQTNGNLTHFFSGCGTGGTITGTATYLKKMNNRVRIVGIQAQQNHLLQGLRNFEESAKPELFIRREQIVDQLVTATNKESFYYVKELLHREGLFVGPSSGSVMAAMIGVSKSITEGVLVGIFADDGRKFKSLYTQLDLLRSDEFREAERRLPPLAYGPAN
ncbi:MAG TPA: cysteine synthase family protein [Nitrososphaeraceae archaeon]